jgi:uroporphyrinogen III methyltransferase/synthase
LRKAGTPQLSRRGNQATALNGKRILITRSKKQLVAVAKKLSSLGAVPIEFPTLEFAPPESFEQVDQAISQIEEFDWVVFTSVNGVNSFLDRMATLEYDIHRLERVKVAAVGPSTGSALKTRGIIPSFVPRRYLTREIAQGLGDKIRGKRILLPRADIASKELRELLESKGAFVEEVVAYRTILPRDSEVSLSGGIFWEETRPDYIMFTSSSTVKNFIRLLGKENMSQMPEGIKIACIGPVTAKTATKLGLRADIVATEHSIDGLIEAMIKHEIGV